MTVDLVPQVLAHLESQIGPVETGWIVTEVSPQYSVVKYANPVSGGTVYGTIGLSARKLHSPQKKGNKIRQELLILAPIGQFEDLMPKLVRHLATEIAKSGHIVRRGELISLDGRPFPDSELSGVYATEPVYFPEGVHEPFQVAGEDVVFVWLVPVTQTEAIYAYDNGWEMFEDLLEQVDPDLVDFNRPSIVP
jgi:hypothetical protein